MLVHAQRPGHPAKHVDNDARLGARAGCLGKKCSPSRAWGEVREVSEWHMVALELHRGKSAGRGERMKGGANLQVQNLFTRPPPPGVL